MVSAKSDSASLILLYCLILKAQMIGNISVKYQLIGLNKNNNNKHLFKIGRLSRLKNSSYHFINVKTKSRANYNHK